MESEKLMSFEAAKVLQARIRPTAHLLPPDMFRRRRNGSLGLLPTVGFLTKGSIIKKCKMTSTVEAESANTMDQDELEHLNGLAAHAPDKGLMHPVRLLLKRSNPWGEKPDELT